MTQVKIFKNATELTINAWLKDNPDVYDIKVMPIGITYPSDDIVVMVVYRKGEI